VPNGGSSWGRVTLGVRQKQEAFLTSLTKECRQQCLARRSNRKIPEHVDFVCVVGHLQVEFKAEAKIENTVQVSASADLRGDGIVSSVRQWTPDLQTQGIPVVTIEAAHFSAMRTQASADKIAQLVRDRHPRWSMEEIAAARKRLFGE
jgi:hypothetical protein